MYERIDAPANAEQKRDAGQALAATDIPVTELAGEKIDSVLTNAPGNGNAIGGVKVIATRRLVRRAPFGHRGHLQDLRREFSDRDHLQRIQQEAQAMIAQVLQK